MLAISCPSGYTSLNKGREMPVVWDKISQRHACPFVHQNKVTYPQGQVKIDCKISTLMKKLFLHLLILLLSAILYSCDNKEPVPIKETDEPISFRLIDSEPVWSPDGKWIAFHHEEPGKSGIYLISPDGANIKKLHDGFAATPAWSPNGQWITFSENAQIWKMKINGDSLTQLTFEGRNFNPSWAINGIAYRRSYSWPEEQSIQGIWFLNPNNEYINQIFSGNCAQVTWFNVENVIFFKGEIDTNGSFTGSSLYKKNIKSSVFELLNFLTNMYNQYPKYTPISNRIAFMSKPNDKSNISIWTIDADGTNLKQLTYTQSYACDWSPDGKYIVYTDARAENGRLWVMDASGGNKQQLTFEHHFINF